MIPTALRDAAIAYIGAKVAFAEIGKHFGRFTVEDLARIGAVTPACRIGIVNLTKPVKRASGEVSLDLSFAAVIIAQPQVTADADDEPVELASAVIAALASWVPAQSVPKALPPANLHAEAVADAAIDEAGLTVWAVLWTHTVTLGADLAAAEIDPAHPLGSPPAVTVTHPTRGEEEIAA